MRFMSRRICWLLLIAALCMSSCTAPSGQSSESGRDSEESIYPLGYVSPWTDDVDLLLAELDTPLREKETPFNEEEARELVRHMLPLGMRITNDMTSTIIDYDEDDNIYILYDEYFKDVKIEDGNFNIYYRVKSNIFNSSAEVEKLSGKVFTDEFYREVIYHYAFEPTGYDEEEDSFYHAPSYIEHNGVLYVHGIDEYWFPAFTNEWQVNTLKIISQGQDELLVEMKFIDRRWEDEPGGYISNYRGKLRLKKENGVWKFDSSLYLVGRMEEGGWIIDHTYLYDE